MTHQELEHMADELLRLNKPSKPEYPYLSEWQSRDRQWREIPASNLPRHLRNAVANKLTSTLTYED